MMRRILMFLALLIFGVLITVAVAWGCAFRPFPVFPTANGPHYETHRRDNGYDATIQIMPGRTRVMQMHDVDLQRGDSFVVEGEAPEAFDRRLPASSVFRGAEPLAQVDWPRRSLYYEDFFGWPCLALTSRRGTAPQFGDTPFEEVGHLAIPQQFQRPNWPRTLPIKPVWSGLAINAIFYAACPGIIIAGALGIRNVIRRRRGIPAATFCPPASARRAPLPHRRDEISSPRPTA